MSDKEVQVPKALKPKITNPLTCRAIVVLTSLSIYLMFFTLDIISAQIAMAFKIPLQNAGVYIEKLYGFRFLAFMVGTFIIDTIYETISTVNNDPMFDTLVIIKEVSYGVMLFARIILLLVVFFSSDLAYHAYFALAFESLGQGCAASYNMATVPKYATIVIMTAHLSRLVTMAVQFVLDLVFRQNALPKIRCQFVFCTILNVISVILFWYYHHGGSGCQPPKETQENGNESICENDCKIKGPVRHKFIETFEKAASPFFMYPIGSMLFDTVHPGVIPYAFLTTERCHLINMFSPFANITGTVVLFGLETAGKYDTWTDEYSATWLWTIPMGIICVYTFLAVHSRIPAARKIINNRPRVWAMTFFGALGNSFMDPVSFSGIAKVLFMTPDFAADLSVMTLHKLFTTICRYFNDKLSVGYNVVRISLGYVFPKFRPNHRMSKWNTFWYVFKQSFRKAGRDVVDDFKFDIKKYL